MTKSLWAASIAASAVIASATLWSVSRAGNLPVDSATHLLQPTPVTDTDGDGLADPVEASIGTDALRADTDNDGFTDGQEVAWNTSPLDPVNFPSVFESVTGWWRLDEGQGAAVADISGRRQNGTVIGDSATAWQRDLDSSVFASDGTRHVEIPQPATVQSGVTVVTLARLADNSEGVLVGRWAETAPRGYALAVENGHLVFHLFVNGVHRPLRSPVPIKDGVWHVVAASYDGFETCTYLDGERVVRSHTGGDLGLNDEPIVIGQARGSFADAIVMKRALRRDEVRLLSQLSFGGVGTVRDEVPLRGAGSSIGRLRFAQGGRPPVQRLAPAQILVQSLETDGGR